MNLRNMIDQAISLAHTAGEVLPPLEGGADLAEKVLDLLDGLKGHSPNAQATGDIEAAHAALYKRISDKGHALSDRLRG